MTVPNAAHPEAYEDFAIGDEVFCLAWIGMPFLVVGKDDETGQIFLDGQGPCSLPEGARVDITPTTMFMVSHNQWDQLWYWPDRAGESFEQVVERFIRSHRDDEIVTGYLGGNNLDSCFAQNIPEWAMSFRLSYAALEARQQIHVQPVAAVSEDAGALICEYDPTIPDERWLPSGPAMALRLEMLCYRWALVYGRIVLNWQDFGRED